MVKIIHLIKKMKNFEAQYSNRLLINLLPNHHFHFKKTKKKYFNFLKKQEIKGEPFYDKIGQFNKFYFPICHSIYQNKIIRNKTFVIGLSGGQGSGKSTIAEIIKIILKNYFNLNAITFSIDNFYKKNLVRKKMSKNISQLFLTRGVPGTHDLPLLTKCFKNAFKKNFKPFFVPVFNKSIDDREPKKKWKKINKRPDVIIFEGWCVGASPQSNYKLNKPINHLEKISDKKLTWRKKVNKELKNKYKRIFKLIDKLIFLKVPSFKYVFKWRLLQEKKLNSNKKESKAMNKNEIKKFIMYYERITKQMLIDLSKSADIVIGLDRKHKLNSLKFKI